MGTVPHTPDPAQGAAIEALGGGNGLIYNPDDGENVRAAIIRVPTEMIADWIAYLRNTGIRQRIQTAGLVMTGPIEHSGPTAYVKQRFAEATVNGGMLNAEQFDEVKWDRSAGIGERTLRSTSPAPPGNISLRIWAPVDAFGLAVVLKREGGSIICTFPANIYSSATVSYWSVNAEWRLSGGFNLDLTGAIP